MSTLTIQSKLSKNLKLLQILLLVKASTEQKDQNKIALTKVTSPHMAKSLSFKTFDNRIQLP